MSNCLEPDQDRHSVGPDLGANCLQKLSENFSRPSLPLAKKDLSTITIKYAGLIYSCLACSFQRFSKLDQWP